MKRLLPLLITLLFLALLFYFVPYKQLLSTLKSISPINFLLAFFLYSLSQLFRSIRWRLLLRELNLYQSFVINSANIMFNNLLPARTGELSWFYYARRFGVNLSYSLWSFFLGRLYDLLVLIFLFLLSLSLFNPLFLVPSVSLLLFGLFLYKSYVILPTSGKLGQLRDFIRREASFMLCKSLFLLSSLSVLSKFFSLLILLGLWHVALYRSFVAFLGGEVSSLLPLHSFLGLGTYEFAFSLPMRLLGESLVDWLKLGFVFHSFLLLSSLLWGVPSVILLGKSKL
ncbi:MAG: lysylphosphatidylglycerol synthase domain-containing protein [Aquificaceae bacterium]|nr:lysylphosphatidylglycerol synthase domain-containing protein [Aquificaceae bacterium]